MEGTLDAGALWATTEYLKTRHLAPQAFTNKERTPNCAPCLFSKTSSQGIWYSPNPLHVQNRGNRTEGIWLPEPPAAKIENISLLSSERADAYGARSRSRPGPCSGHMGPIGTQKHFKRYISEMGEIGFRNDRLKMTI